MVSGNQVVREKLLVFQFSIVFNNSLYSSPNKENPEKIETELDVVHKIRKILDLFYFRHDLGYPEKNPDSGKRKNNAPDDFSDYFVFIHGLMTSIPRIPIECSKQIPQ